MRRLPLYLAALFIIITLDRVASFVVTGLRAGWLGWVFSLGLGVGVFLSAYFNRLHAIGKDGEETPGSRRARRVALLALLFFIGIDGFFNLAETLRQLPPEVLAGPAGPMMKVAAGLYGLFPTVAAGLLGILQGYVDRLPVPPRRSQFSISVRLKTLVYRLLPAPTAAELTAIRAEAAEVYAEIPARAVAAPQIEPPAPAPAVAAPQKSYTCPDCRAVYSGPNAQYSYSAHRSQEKRKRAKEEAEKEASKVGLT